MAFFSAINWSVVGLLIIFIAWLIQVKHSWKHSKELSRDFLIAYAIGVIVLVVDGFRSNLTQLAVLNLLTIIPAIILLIKIKK